MTDTIVIGAGLAGLTAAIRLAQSGRSVTLLSFGLGGAQLGQGTIDVLGYTDGDRLVRRPFEELPAHLASHPGHPYALVGAETVGQAMNWLAGLLPELLLPGDGSNHLVPTSLGAMRPTYLVQPSMAWPDVTSLAVVGPRQIKDFHPALMAANLEQTAHIQARGYQIDLPARPGEVDSSPVVYAKALDDPRFLARFADQVGAAIGQEEAVALPAVLGLRSPDVWRRLADRLGRPVVETLMPPPSIPGMRLNEALTALAKSLGVRVVLGSKVTGFQAEADAITAVSLHQAGRDQLYTAKELVYAGGGFESGSLALDSQGQVTETLFGLPLTASRGDDLITGDYWADQALFAVGVSVDETMRPVGADRRPICRNLRAVGGLLAGAIRWSEKSGDAIAVASAVRAADAITGRPAETSEKGDN